MKTNHSSRSGPARSTAPQIIFTNPISKPVPKRSQVSRACDWCRALRIKCDNLYPCRNCQNRARPCNPRGMTATLSRRSDLSQKAALQKQEKDLEKQLDLADPKTEDYDVKSTKNNTKRLLQDAEVKIEPSSSVSVPPDVEKLQVYTGHRGSETLKSYPTQPPDTLHRQIYGRPSCVFFIGRLSPHLDLPPIQMTMSGLMQSMSQGGQTSDETSHIQVSLTGTYLTKSQEEYFLQVFFPTYNVYYPIVDYNEFLNHYKSLWTSPTTRKQSALVDIVLALSMQYANALVPRDKNLAASYMNIEGIANVDISIASRSFFRRCQLLLNDELEEPSLTTVQCHFFSVVYLWNSYLHNAAHTHLAMAIRTGVILGIHWRPAPTLSEKQAEFQKRLWWTVYALELKMSMALGRPPSITLSQILCPPPDRHQEDPFTHQGTNRFTANRNFIRLMLAGHAAYTALQTKCSEVLGQDDNRTIESLYEDPALLEIVAEGATSTATYHFQKWQQELPDPLKTKRQNSGEPLSTDRSALNLKEGVPLGMSRQRLFLELLYHTLSMNIFRFFIYFPCPPPPSPPSSSSSFVRQTNTPTCDSNAILSVNHAITITNIVYQVLQESNFLAGFHDTFQWQWNATLTLIAFLTAFPHGPLTTPARDALTTAINVFDIIGKYLGIACTAAKVTRELFARVNYFSTLSSNGLDYTGSNTAPSLTCADMPGQSWRYSMDWNMPVGNEHVAGGSRVYGNSETISDIASSHCIDLAVFESAWIALQEEQGRLEGNFEFHI